VVAVRAGQALRLGVVQRQGVEGQVVRPQRQRSLERRHPRRDRTTGHVVQEIDVHRADPALVGGRDRVRDVARLVPPPQPLQLSSVEALSTDRQPRHAGAGERRGVPALVRPGVRLDRDLSPAGDAEPAPDQLDQRGDLVGRDERRRPAAQVDRLDRRPSTSTGFAKGRVQRVGPQADLGH
jgi:hypothetical protein